MGAVGPSGRVQIEPDWTEADVEALAAEPSLEVLQYSEYNVPSRELLKLLNDRVFALRPDVLFRIYGFHLKEADLSALTFMTDVERLAVDCCSRVSGLSPLGGLSKLRELELDVFELDSFEALHEVRSDLVLLRLGKTRSKKPDLSVLKWFAALERLALNGQKKNIEVVQELQRLRTVYIQGIPLGDLGFLASLPRLEKLDLGFGGAENLEWLAGLGALKELKLLRIKGLNDLSVLSELKELRLLKIIDQPLIGTLPSLDNLLVLKRVVCDNVGLKKWDWVLTAPALDELVFLEMQTLTPEDFREMVGRRRPNRLTVSMKKASANKEIQAILEQEGLNDKRGWWL